MVGRFRAVHSLAPKRKRSEIMYQKSTFDRNLGYGE
jgi:hypothetical protein